ncbi:MAG: MerR family transcriptional regulator [Candidatus Omnitrophica bacterium]|nr:MerR family transcriptional regulator [Candidatus Omnitrophota bacterium]
MAYRDIYLIKDLSRITGLSIYTIKYYLKMGLIKEVGRSSETNFRYFDSQTADDLKKIIAYKKENLSLTKILELMKEKSAAV